MTHSLVTHLAAAWPPVRWRDVAVLLAVSGGADSAALLRATAALADEAGQGAAGGRLIVAHFNHRLRGAESDAEERFVVELCERLGIPCEVGRASRESPDRQRLDALASEEYTRHERYDFLRHTALRLGARYVATAHTSDDQVETILHRIVRGTGLSGLAGIPRVRLLAEGVALVRPMLDVSRKEVLAYLAELEQPFRQDASNGLPRYTRNRLRNDLLPRMAAEYNPEVADALLRLGRLAAEAQLLLSAAAEELLQRAVFDETDAVVTLDLRRFAGESRYLVREAFVSLWRRRNWPRQAFGQAEWDLLAELALAPSSGRQVRMLPGNLRAESQGARLTLTPPRDERA